MFQKQVFYEIDIYEFPKKLVAGEWNLPWLPPDNIVDQNTVQKQLEQESNGLPMHQLLVNTDRVIVATTLGQIKVMGEVSACNKDLALRSLLRMQLIGEIEGFAQSQTYSIIYQGLDSFENPKTQPIKLCQKMIAYLDCPYEVFDKLLDDDNMIYACEKALKQGKEEGFTPLLVIVDETLFEQVTMLVDEDSEMDFAIEKVRSYRQKLLLKQCP